MPNPDFAPGTAARRHVRLHASLEPSSPMLPAALLDLLRRYLDEEAGADALQQACALASREPVDIAALLDWLRDYRCDPARRTQAIRSLRAALRLPVIPGAVCRPD